MALYSILLTLLGDKQEKVDAFICTVDPGVAQSASPIKKRQRKNPRGN